MARAVSSRGTLMNRGPGAAFVVGTVADKAAHMLDCLRGEEERCVMINENVSDSAAATQQQHLVRHRALVYIQWIGGGPVHTQPAELEKVVGIRGFGGRLEAVSLIPSLPTMAAEVEKVSKFFTAYTGFQRQATAEKHSIHQLC